MATTARYTKKFAHLRHTRAVSALEYAILVGVFAVVIFVAYETFRSDIREAIIVIKRLLSGG